MIKFVEELMELEYIFIEYVIWFYNYKVRIVLF